MYICLCHAITDRDVRSAEQDGAVSDSEVFRHFGVQPRCGRCIGSMRCLLGCAERALEDAPGDTAPCRVPVSP